MSGLVIEATARDVQGTTRAKLRTAQQIPAVIYGHGLEATSIAVPEKPFQGSAMVRKALVVVKLGNQTINAMVHDVQLDPLSRKVLHIDFIKVNLDEPIDIKVPLQLTGIEAVERRQGIVQQQTREVALHALPQQAPEFLTVDVSSLAVGHHLTMADLTLPQGVELRSDVHEVIVSVIAAKRTSTTDEPAAEGVSTEEA